MTTVDPPYRRLRLYQPSLSTLADCLERGCRLAFEEVSVDVVDCPDLSGGGFRLSGSGICGSPTSVHVGGVPYLMPTPQADTRRYDLNELLKVAGCPDGLAIGAGAASSALFGKNAELVANQGPLGNGCRIASVVNDADRSSGLANCRLSRPGEFAAEVNMLGDLACSRGHHGAPVLRLRVARWRPRSDDHEAAGTGTGWRVSHFAELLQRTLAEEFASQDLPVSLGGVFRLTGSPARMHVMPDFSPTPLTCLDEVNQWLHFVDMPDPLVCCGTLTSHDPRGWGLRLEHFHGWNPDTEAFGGHYHNDTKPEAAEYLAYFSLAEAMVRVDPPNGVDSLRDD